MATTTTTPDDKTIDTQQDTMTAYDLDDDKTNAVNVSDDGDRSNTSDSNNNNNNNNSDDDDDDDRITEAVHGHPLQDAANYSPDIQDQSDKSLLDAHGSPNVSRSPSALNSPVVTPTEPEVLDASPAKGFQNTGDHPAIIQLDVTGKLPDWLTAEHYTVGPGTYDIKYTRKIEVDGHLQSATGTFTFGHLLDGLPLVNRFDLNGDQNTISYRSRLTSRRMIEKIRDHHGYAPCHPAGLFNTHANQTVLIKFMKAASKPSKPDGEPCGSRILTSIPGVDGHLFCQNMANHAKLNPFDLTPTRLLTWDEINPAFRGYNACPNGHHDITTGEYINFSMEIGYRTTRYHFFSTTQQNPRGTLITTIPNTPTGYVNSFSITPSYIILAIFPMLAHSSAVKFAWNESIMDSFAYYPTEPTLFYVISREKAQVVANYRAPASFGLHHANAFEDDSGQLFVDIVTYKDNAILHHLTTDQLRSATSPLPPSELRRYHLSNLTTAEATYNSQQSYLPSISSLWGATWYNWMPLATHTVLGHDLELPTLHPAYKTKPYTTLYGLGVSDHSATYWDTLVKLNVTTGARHHWHQPGCYPNEALFIPRHPTDEHDGVLVSVVLDVLRATSFLLVLDASTLTELARADVGMVIPLSLGRGSFKRRH